MHLGPKLIIPGTIFGSIFLASFLYVITAGATFPQTVLAAVPSPTPEVGQTEAQPEPQVGGLVDPSIESQATTTTHTTSSVECTVSDAFPQRVRQWCDLIMENADKHGLPVDLIAAVIWQESGGDESAYSKSGAVGLMQVMPSDGKAASFMCINGPCFTDRPTIAELEDPEFNIRYGSKMLASLSKRYGNYRDALKNYGPRDVGYYYADIVMSLYQQYGN